MQEVGVIRKSFATFSGGLQDLPKRHSHSKTLAEPGNEPETMEEAVDVKAVIRMPGETNGVVLSGHPMTFLVTAEHSKHTSMFDWTMPPRFSTGLHVHRTQEETFYVLDGECEWQIGDRRIRATPGTFLFVPPGTPHDIANATDRPARLLMTVSPPGHERYFEELANGIRRDSPPDATAIAELRRRYDTDQLSALKN